MNSKILQDPNPRLVRDYVTKKFKIFKGWTYSTSTRRKKCVAYWIAASHANRDIVEEVYNGMYNGELFPSERAENEEEALVKKISGPHKMASGDWERKQEKKAAKIEETLNQLKKWMEEGEYQTGPSFFIQMKSLVSEVDPQLCDQKQFLTEFEARRVAELTGNRERTAREVKAEFDGMLGLQQKTSAKFDAYNPRLGQFAATFEQEFKAGIWTAGSFEAVRRKTKLSVEAAAALAIGAQLSLDGKCTWKTPASKMGLELAGNAELFAGARVQGEAKLSASVLDGIEASISLGAFAGVSASISGSCSLTYDDETLIGANASAQISVGAGATLDASIKASIFGATEISFASSLVVGVGTGTSIAVEINFNQIYLAGANEFRKVIYLPTIAKGYKMDLMTQDAKNLHYLKKCIAVLDEELKGTDEKLESFRNINPEKQSLLMASDD